MFPPLSLISLLLYHVLWTILLTVCLLCFQHTLKIISTDAGPLVILIQS